MVTKLKGGGFLQEFVVVILKLVEQLNIDGHPQNKSEQQNVSFAAL